MDSRSNSLNNSTSTATTSNSRTSTATTSNSRTTTSNSSLPIMFRINSSSFHNHNNHSNQGNLFKDEGNNRITRYLTSLETPWDQILQLIKRGISSQTSLS